MRWDDAIDLVCLLNNDPEDNWKYCAEIDAITKKANIACYDENNVFVSYLNKQCDEVAT